MSHLFIAHSTKDKAYVRKLAAELRKRGFDVWIDDKAIRGGQHWMAMIAQAINNCAALIVVMSPNSEDSTSWVNKEIALAIKRNKPIFPLLLAGDEFFSLIDLQYTDVTNGRMPPESFYDALQEEIPFRSTRSTTRYAQPAVKPAPALSRQYSLQVEYQNFKGERKSFAVDPKTIKIPAGRGRPSTKHLSMCVAPTGTRIALKRSNVLNLAEVERALARYG